MARIQLQLLTGQLPLWFHQRWLSLVALSLHPSRHLAYVSLVFLGPLPPPQPTSDPLLLLRPLGMKGT